MKECECEHDYENPKRINRAHFVCRKCGEDITMDLLYTDMEYRRSKSHTDLIEEVKK